LLAARSAVHHGLMELTDALRTTGAVREFTDEPVDDATLARVLDTARFAPSGGAGSAPARRPSHSLNDSTRFPSCWPSSPTSRRSRRRPRWGALPVRGRSFRLRVRVERIAGSPRRAAGWRRDHHGDPVGGSGQGTAGSVRAARPGRRHRAGPSRPSTAPAQPDAGRSVRHDQPGRRTTPGHWGIDTQSVRSRRIRPSVQTSRRCRPCRRSTGSAGGPRSAFRRPGW
jgi:hypothetical protein